MPEILCPACKMGDQVEKVSSIYLNGIGLKPQQPDSETRVSSELVAPLSSQLSPPQLKQLSQRLKPPSTPKQAFTRPLHPDMVVLTFSLVAPFFLYGIYSTQHILFYPALLILAVVYGLYYWKRKPIIAKYQRNLDERTKSELIAKRGIERWMKLYYCARDDGIFEVRNSELIPVDFMPGYLLQE